MGSRVWDMAHARPQAAAAQALPRAVPHPFVPAATSATQASLGARHRLDAFVDGNVIQRVIPAVSTAGTLGAMRVMQNLPPTDPVVDMGLTDDPVNYLEPTYAINAAPDLGGAIRATVTKTQGPSEGNVRSLYVAAGSYATNYRWRPPAEVYDPPPGNPALWLGENRKETTNAVADSVNWEHLDIVVSNAIANLSLQAENEHLADLRLAYLLTLLAADGALNAVIANMPLNGYTATLAGVPYADVPNANADVAARITAALPVASATLGANSAHWAAEYARLFGKTSRRDAQRWHSFGLDSGGFWYNGKLAKSLSQLANWYAGRGNVATHYADVVVRGHMNIGGTPSANLIDFGP